MAVIRHLRHMLQTWPAVLALALIGLLGTPAPAPATAGGVARVPAVTAGQVAPSEAGVDAPARAGEPTAPAVGSVPVVDRVRAVPAQRVADVRNPRGPPAVVI